MSNNGFQAWLEQHLEDAQKEYGRIQAIEEGEEGANDPDLYDRVHEMWGYLAGLEKCLKEFKTRRPS
jgi:hypothetical protein